MSFVDTPPGFAPRPHRPTLRKQHPLASGARGVWVPTQSQRGGAVQDIARVGIPGTLQSGVSWAALNGETVLSFDGGASAEVNLGDTIIDLAPTQGTVVCLIRPSRAYDNPSGDGLWGDINGTGFGAQRYINATVYIGWISSGNDDRVAVALSASTWLQNQWNLYVFTWRDGGTSYLYHQGSQIGSQANCTVATVSESMKFGGPAFGTTDFSGQYGFFGIWNYPWDPAQVARYRDYRSLWSLITPPTSLPANAPSGTSIPVFVHHYRQLRRRAA